MRAYLRLSWAVQPQSMSRCSLVWLSATVVLVRKFLPECGPTVRCFEVEDFDVAILEVLAIRLVTTTVVFFTAPTVNSLAGN